MNKEMINMEPLCETSEKGEKLFVKTEIEQIGLEIGRRIVEAFGYLPDSEIAVLLKTNTETVRKFTEDGRLPPTEILLGIHKLTGASLDWLLTGQNAPAKKIVPLRRYRHRKQQSLAA